MFGAVKLTNNADISKYKYSGYGIGFDGHGTFSFPIGGFGQNVIIFGVDISSSVDVDNKKKDILILGEGHTQGLYKTALTAEKNYSINFTVIKKKFCLRLNYNGTNSYLFYIIYIKNLYNLFYIYVMEQTVIFLLFCAEIIKFKAKNSEIIATPLCLGNISEDFSNVNMKKIGLLGYVYDFSVDYDAIAVDDMLNIHKYLMKKNSIV